MAGPYTELPASRAGQSVRVLVDMWMLDDAGERVPFRGKGLVWHAHVHVELSCISTGILQVGEHSGHFTAPDCLLLGSGLPHVWKARGASSGTSVQFRLESDSIWSAPEFAACTPLWQKARQGMRWKRIGRIGCINDLIPLSGK